MKKSALDQVVNSIQEWTLFGMTKKEIISAIAIDLECALTKAHELDY